MPLDALALALGAAVLHALWNLLLARERDTEAATAVALISLVAVLVLPAVLTWHVESAAVPYVLGSAALELAYVGLLAAAYRRFDLSVVYPVARGLAPVLALILLIGIYPKPLLDRIDPTSTRIVKAVDAGHPVDAGQHANLAAAAEGP